MSEGKLDEAEGKLANVKHLQEENDLSKARIEELLRKVQLLEEELDKAEKNLKETVGRLQQMDLKAEHYERQAITLEADRDKLEKDLAALNTKYAESKLELDQLVATMDGL